LNRRAERHITNDMYIYSSWSSCISTFN